MNKSQSSQIDRILEQAFGQDIAMHILQAYREILDNFLLKKWKTSELDAGHFVEAVRRAIEKELFGTSTPFTKKLPDFNDVALKGYENAQGDESFRMLIPRNLKSVYNIRNKRGVGHAGVVSPNEMDATYILFSVKWVLCELIRLKSGLSISETQHLVNQIIERKVELMWQGEGVKRILDCKMDASKQVLIFLYDENPLFDLDISKRVEYKNFTNFKKILKRLHGKRLLEYAENGSCEITTLGIIEAEKILKI